MTLMKEKVSKNGMTYTDFYLVWVYKEKTYSVRVMPCFGDDYDKLYACAVVREHKEPADKFE